MSISGTPVRCSREQKVIHMKCRTVKPEDKKEVYYTVQKGHPFGSMTHLKWKDKDLWIPEYTVVAEHDNSIAAVAFFEPQTKVVCSTGVDVLAGGGGAVLGLDPKECYTEVMTFAVDMAHSQKKALMTYVAQNEFTYPVLKELGFYHLFSQRKYVMILNVKKMITIAAEKLNKAGVPGNISLTVRIIPDSEPPFAVQVHKGMISIKEDTPSDVEVSGAVKSLVAFMTGGIRAGAILLVLRRTVKIRVRIAAVVQVIHLLRVLW